MIDLVALWKEILAGDPVLRERPDFKFDPEFYARSYPGAPGTGRELFRHYRDVGRKAGRFPTRFRQLRAAEPGIGWQLRRLIHDERLRTALEHGQQNALELAFELMRLGYDSEISNFSGAHYLDSNPDVANAGVDPLEHYLRHGINEGRPALAKLADSHFRGARDYDPGLPTCLIAVHELSQTGAPYVGLHLAQEASRTHNVIVASLRGGPLLDAMRETACEVVVTANPHADFDHFQGDAFTQIDVAVCNSVETFPFIRLLVARGIPFASYIHEYTWYTFPTYKSIHTALFSDLLVFSSEHVRDSWLPVLRDVELDQGEDLMIIPQREFRVGSVDGASHARARQRLSRMIGRDCTDKRIICGAGATQWRKGTDIFAMAAQIARHRDPDTLFVWVGDGLSPEDPAFGVWMTHHLSEAGAGDPTGNLFMLPAGDHYRDVLAAADAMFLSSRLDPLPNVVFDALDAGCRIVLFEGASGFTDPTYQDPDLVRCVEYANPDAAATALLELPLKLVEQVERPPAAHALFSEITASLHDRVAGRRRIVMGATPLDVPVLYSGRERDREVRVREREKLFTLQRRHLWRDAATAQRHLRASDNWVHRQSSVADYREVDAGSVAEFSIHLHAYYVGGLAAEFESHVAYQHARQVVVTTNTEEKAAEVETALAKQHLPGRVLVVPNRGRDILPFLELSRSLGTLRPDEIWCHVHQKKSVASTTQGDLWREFLTSILLGSDERMSDAARLIGREGVGLVTAFDPHYGQWNASRALLATVEPKFSGPLPENPMVYPMGNMFWVRGEVVSAMNALFDEDHTWPNEPIPNDGTEFHLIERLWPAVAAECGLESVFMSKPDQPRRL